MTFEALDDFEAEHQERRVVRDWALETLVPALRERQDKAGPHGISYTGIETSINIIKDLLCEPLKAL